MLKLAVAKDELVSYVSRQLNHLFPDGRAARRAALAPSGEEALARVERGFSSIRMKYYSDGAGGALFDPLHTDQYAAFLYLLSHAIYRAGGDLRVAAKVYALNKALHALDVYYEVELPEIFVFHHPVGTVLGRGRYANYLFVHQGCTVGSDINDRYPALGEGIIMYTGSAVFGNCAVGSNCWLSAGTQVLETDVPSGTVVFGRSPDLVIKPTRRDVIKDVFGALPARPDRLESRARRGSDAGAQRRGLLLQRTRA